MYYRKRITSKKTCKTLTHTLLLFRITFPNCSLPLSHLLSTQSTYIPLHTLPKSVSISTSHSYNIYIYLPQHSLFNHPSTIHHSLHISPCLSPYTIVYPPFPFSPPLPLSISTHFPSPSISKYNNIIYLQVNKGQYQASLIILVRNTSIVVV